VLAALCARLRGGLKLGRHRTRRLVPPRVALRLRARLRLGALLTRLRLGKVVEVRGESCVLDRAVFLALVEQEFRRASVPPGGFGELALVAVLLRVRYRASDVLVAVILVTVSWAGHGARWY
jgi:hypothetical protein